MSLVFLTIIARKSLEIFRENPIAQRGRFDCCPELQKTATIQECAGVATRSSGLAKEMGP